MKIYISILLFLIFNISNAQLQIKKIAKNDVNILDIDLNKIDEIIIVSSTKNVFEIEEKSTSINTIAYHISNNILYISELPVTENTYLEGDKFGIDQGDLPSYVITIPLGIKVNIAIKEGNFKALNVKGDISLQLNTGIATINNLKGNLTVEMIYGKINGFFKEGVFDVDTKLGTISTNLIDKNLKISNQKVKGFLKDKNFLIKIKTINGVINLNKL